MAKHYIIPATQSHQITPTCFICGVGSVHGNAGLEYGGGSNGEDPNEKPF